MKKEEILSGGSVLPHASTIVSAGTHRELMRTAILLIASLTPTITLAQLSTAKIAGTVEDGAGAKLAKATITLTDQRTGAKRTAATDSDGAYLITQLQPSTYTLQVEDGGFTPSEDKNVVLQVGAEVTRNVTLQVAGTAETVTVDAGGLANLDTSSARIGVNVSEREVAQLPINGRQVSQLYLMTPGAVNSGGGGYDNIRFSGRSNQQNIIRVDGVENTSIIDASPGNLNGESSSNFRLQQSLENVQEFRVDSSNYPAEYGTGTGGQVSFVTKSGSNRFHGAAFEYLRNDLFDARNYFNPRGSLTKLRLNQFGGSVGGPLVKDRMFFFGSYEGLRQSVDTPFVETTLSAAARAQADPSIQPLLAAFPVGQFATSNPLLDAVRVIGPNTLSENSGGLRLDYVINNRFHLYGRYFRDQGVSSQTQNSTLSKYNQTAVPQNAVISLTQVWTPTIFNETKVGMNAVKERVLGVPGPSPNADLTGVTLNLTGSVALGGIAGQTGAASIAQPTGLIRLSSAFNGRGAPYTNTSFSFIDNLSIVKGQHSVKLGVEIRPITLYNDQLGGTTYSFADVNAFLANKPTSIQFNGDLSAQSPFTGLSGRAKLRQNYFIGYAQDEWKLRQNLTISYGLRYEYYQPLHETRNKDVFFSIPDGTIFPRYGKDWYGSSVLNFGPRLAVAYSPTERTVLRVGGGYFYGPGQTEDQLQPEANDRIGTTISSGSQLRYPLDIPSVYANYNIDSPTLGYQPRAYAPNYQIPEKVLSYSASLEQQFGGGVVGTVAYVGSQGRNLFLRSITNLITNVATNPTTGAAVVTRQFGGRFAEIDYKTSGGADSYNALQTSLNRRFTSGLTMGAQYTWGRSIGNSAGSNEANTVQNPFDFDADRGRNNFDIRHSMNVFTLYPLPVGRGRRYGANMARALDLIAGGWQAGGILNFRSGVPIDVLIVRPDTAFVDQRNGSVYSAPLLENGVVQTQAVINTPGGGSSRNVRRPNIVPGVNPYIDRGTAYLNPAAFSIPAPGTFGNFTRNNLSGPVLSQLDLTLSKSFTIREGTNVEFRSEIYNILNHPNFANPGNLRLSQGLTGSAASSLQPGQPFTPGTAGGNFGALNGTVSNQVGLGTNRQIQLALRLNF